MGKKAQTGTIVKIFGWLSISAGTFIGYTPLIQNKASGYLFVGIGFLLLGVGEFFK